MFIYLKKARNEKFVAELRNAENIFVLFPEKYSVQKSTKKRKETGVGAFKTYCHRA